MVSHFSSVLRGDNCSRSLPGCAGPRCPLSHPPHWKSHGMELLRPEGPHGRGPCGGRRAAEELGSLFTASVVSAALTAWICLRTRATNS